MVNPFWHNPDFALKQIKSVIDDWQQTAKELTYVEKGYTKFEDTYEEKQRVTFESVRNIVKCVYEDEKCLPRY